MWVFVSDLTYFGLALLLTVAKAEIEDGISYIVRAGKTDCFYRDLKSGNKMDIDFQVMSGGDADLTMYILGPSGQFVLNQYRKNEVTAVLPIEESGTYKICFDNTFSLFTDKVVYFDLGIQEDENQYQNVFSDLNLVSDNLDIAVYNSFLGVISNVAQILETVYALQGVNRARMARHQFLQETNLSLVTWFSIVSCLVMIAVGGLQVALIRNLFKEKKLSR